METGVTKMSSKGQIVIPLELRTKLRLKEGESFSVSAKKDLIVLKKIDTSLEKDDLETLEEIKKAWKEIEEGKFVKFKSKEEFLENFKKW